MRHSCASRTVGSSAGSPRETQSLTDSAVIPGPSIIHAETDAHWAAGRRLVEEYAQSLGVDLGFQDFAHELASLQAHYAPPDGRFLLCECDGEFAGCVALRRFDAHDCEMKRMHVTPAFRGRGLGRVLAMAIIAEAKAVGYRRMLLDTMPFMTAAHRLYESLGFKPIPAYRHNPVAGTTFLALDLK